MSKQEKLLFSMETVIMMETMTKYVLWDDLSIVCGDTHGKLLCNEHVVPLTPTEYRLCSAFLKKQARQLALKTDAFVFPYIPRSILQQRVGIPNKQLLRKHISNTNAKLAPYHLHIRSFEQGYVLVNLRAFTSTSNDE